MNANVFTTPLGENARRVWTNLQIEKRPLKRKVPPASADILHKVYGDLLHCLPLHDEHLLWLEKRGIDRNWALTHGYRSTVDIVRVGKYEFAELDSDRFRPLLKHKQVLWGCPGFSDIDNGRIGLRSQAILIPCRDRYGRIQAIKQRLLDGKGPRMRWLASSGKVVPAVVNKPHYPVGVGYPNKWQELWITEGERKADCNWINTGNPTIGVTGTGCWRHTIDTLAGSLVTNGTIVLAFDKDDAGVAASNKVVAELRDKQVIIKVANWSGEKGIDDAVVKGKEITTDIVTVEKQSPPHTQMLQKLRDESSVLDWLMTVGPIARDKVPTNPAIMTRLINSKKIRYGYKDGTQVVFI